MAGQILRRVETPVPNTKISMKSFDVSYLLPAAEGSDQPPQTINERRVKSDRIRLLVGAAGEVKVDAAPPPANFNPDTGTALCQPFH